MARTKRHATARRAESAQAATGVNDGQGDRVDGTPGGEESIEEASMASSSESARREDTREETAGEQAMQGTDGRQAPDGQTTCI